MLVGRQRELQVIEQALAAARLGSSSRLVIRGEPGIGKTSLLDHAVAHAESMNTLAARGVEFEADLPFAGLHELLRPALALIDRLSPRHAAALRSSLGLGDRIEADRLIVGTAVLDLISAYAEQAPLLVTIDDAQWLDRASAEAIAFAARRLVADPVAILIAVREGEESPFLGAGLPDLKLDGLDADSAAALLEASGGADAARRPVEQMVRATGGNPLALIELAHAAPDSQVSAFGELPVTTTVERAYLRRTEGLSRGARQALLLIAAGGNLELALVRRASSLLGIAAEDEEMAESARGLTEAQHDRVGFVHPLARAALYHAASPAQRLAAHQALASVMTDPGLIDRRALHLAAGTIEWDAEVAMELENAARRAGESSAYDTAATFWAESARLTESLEVRAERKFHGAEAAWLAGRAERALELLDGTAKYAGSIALRADIETLAGTIAMRRGAVMEGHRQLTATARTVEAIDRLKSIRILADAALAAIGAGHPSEMLPAAAHALKLLEPDDPAETAVFALVPFGVMAILAGRGSEGAQRLHESLAFFDLVPPGNVDPLLLISAGLAGLFLRETEAQRSLIERATAQARVHAPTAALPVLLFIGGRDAAATDRWQFARAQYEESARLARETTQMIWVATTLAGLSWLAALEGREEECRSQAAEGGALCEQYGLGVYRSWSFIALGQLELGLGRPERALVHLNECVAFLDSVAIDDPDLSPDPDIVDALVRLGRLGEAREINARYQVSAISKGQPFPLARAARARGMLAPDSEYRAEFEAALRHHAETTDLFERARTQLYFGERLRRNRRRVEARKQLGEALKAFDQLGAAPWSERALTELQASGETATLREDRYRQQLTPQELQVAMTLAEGATTREAAARLYLSPKTVEYHLRHVYDKLEVRTREELRGALARQTGTRTSRKGLMFTDLAGSTALLEAIGDEAWQNLSSWLDREMRRSFKEHQGREVDHAGDGFFVIFESASDSISCAVDIQRRMAVHRRQHGYAPQVRIGIHSGEVTESDSSVRGTAVHRAARLCAQAAPNTILASREALQDAGQRLTGLRRLTLKGIKESVEAADVSWEAVAG